MKNFIKKFLFLKLYDLLWIRIFYFFPKDRTWWRATCADIFLGRRFFLNNTFLDLFFRSIILSFPPFRNYYNNDRFFDNYLRRRQIFVQKTGQKGVLGHFLKNCEQKNASYKIFDVGQPNWI